MIFNKDLKAYKAPMESNVITALGYLLRVTGWVALTIILGIDLEGVFQWL